MLDFIKKIQEKVREWPAGKRRAVAFLFSGAISGIIFMVWIVGLSSRLDPQQSVIADDVKAGSEVTPFGSLRQSVSDLAKGMKTRIDEFRDSAAALQGIENTGEEEVANTSSTPVHEADTIDGEDSLYTPPRHNEYEDPYSEEYPNSDSLPSAPSSGDESSTTDDI